MREGMLQIFLVQLLHRAVLVGEAQWGVLVQLIEVFSAFAAPLLSVVDGLAAATTAAGGASHAFDEVIMHLARLQRVDQLADVAQAVDHRRADGDIARPEGALFPALQTAHAAEGVGVGVFTGDKEIGGAERRFHDAARGAEDHARAGALAQRIVKFTFLQAQGLDLAEARHADKLAGGDGFVHVAARAGVVDLIHGAFVLFRRAGHDGNAEDLFGVDAQLFGKIGLCHGAEHLLRALGGGEILQQFGVTDLGVPHPSGAAGGEHGQLVFFGMGQALHKFAALFHDGQVGGKIGVEHVVKADGLEHRHHTADGGLLQTQAEALAPGGADSRRDLHHADLFRIVERRKNLVGIVTGAQRAHGTVGDALAAIGTAGILQLQPVAHAHTGMGAGAGHVPDVHVLDLIAERNAAHAIDALGRFTDQNVLVVPGAEHGLLREGQIQHVHFPGQRLQRAVAAAGAAGAVGVVAGEDQLDVQPPCSAHAGRIGTDHHALFTGGVAGSHQQIVALYLYHAHPAGADLIHILQIAQRGDPQTQLAGSGKDRRSLFNRDDPSVDGQGYHASFLPPRNAPYPK